MKDQHPRYTFERAISLLKQNALPEAEELCREAIAKDSADINFAALLGTILASKGELSEAVLLLKQVVKVAPGHAKVHEELGTVLMQLDDPEAALHHLKRARGLGVNGLSIVSKLVRVNRQLGHLSEADSLGAEAAALSPFQAKLDEATRLFAEGKVRQSESITKELVKNNPEDVNAALLLARIATNASCFDEAKAILEGIIEKVPSFVAPYHELAGCLRELREHEAAVLVLEKALEIDTKNARSHYFYAAALATAARPADAAVAYRQAIALNPELAGAYVGLGHVLKTLGLQDDGIVAYRSAIKLRPAFGETYFSLSNLKTFEFTRREVEAMEAYLADENIPNECRVHFAFSLGKSYEDSQDYEKAFRSYRMANELHRQTIAYDPVQTQVAHERMRSTFDADFFSKLRSITLGNPAPDPIFIVGLPRSGSTLLEQILASHSMVDGTGELPDISMIAQALNKPREGQLFPGCMINLSQNELNALGETYLENTRRQRGSAPFFTDKMPNNFAYVGFIKTILPNAKIIDARRHPMDSCLGCYKQHFAKGQTFTYDLFELGEFYLEYDQLMNHWDEVLPGEVLRVQYESVVEDLEAEVRRILDFCHLPFEDACLSFHETKRAVRTASSEQVRQPIYRRSVQTWKRYGDRLTDLREILSPLLAEHESRA